MKLVFMGTPDFAVPVLDALARAGHEVSLVITQPDRAGNRGKVVFSPVKEKALELGIDVIQPEDVNSEDSLRVIEDISPDAGVVVAYGQILRKDILAIPSHGMLNVHASLLPKLRGASPMQRAILDGEAETGVTVMRISEGLDSGDMLIKRGTPVDGKNFEELHDELASMGAELILEALEKLGQGEAVFEKQDDNEATYAGLIKKSDGKIDFSEEAVGIERKVRAFDPWPGAFFDLGGKQVKLWKAGVGKKDAASAPGTVTEISEDGITVSCGKGSLVIQELQMPGKKRVKVKDFLMGHSVAPGDILR